MKKRRLVLVLCGSIVVAALVALMWPGEREPEYKGRTLSEWIEIHRRSADAAESGYPPAIETRESEEAVRQIGTNALPWLLEWVQSEPSDSEWWARARGVVYKLPGKLRDNPFAEWLITDRATVRLELAYEGFSILNSNAAAAIPELTRLMNQERSRLNSIAAMCALSRIGPDGVPPLLDILADPKNPEWNFAAWAVGSAAKGSTNIGAVVRLLCDHVTDLDAERAATAAMSLGHLRAEPETCIPILARGLEDTRERVVRSACARSLGGFGVKARPAIPQLTAALSDSDWEVRRSATNALALIAPEGLEVSTPVR